MTGFCRESGQTVSFTLEDVAETSSRTGRPSRVRMVCRRCRRTDLLARVQLTQLDPDDHTATVPHHYRREEPPREEIHAGGALVA